MAQELSVVEKRIVGTKQILRLAPQSMLEKVFIAKDSDEAIISKIKQACVQNNISYDISYTMHQIGSACQIEVGSACAALLKYPV